MSGDDIALMFAILGATFVLAGAIGWFMRNARADVALMAGSGAALGGISLLLYTT